MKYSFVALILLGALMWAVTGCRASERRIVVDAHPTAPDQQEGIPVLLPGRQTDVPVMPTQRDLTPQARELFAYLLLVQAILDEDEAGLLESAECLAHTAAPPGVWLDGALWLMSRKSPNTIVYLEQALKAYPDDTNLNLLYADALGDHGMAGRGVEAMRSYLHRHPNDVDGRQQLALLLVKNKEFEEAQKVLKGIGPKERNYLVDFNHARALIGMDKRSEAIPYLKKVVKEQPDFAEALAELAFAQEEEGNLREARTTYERLQKLGFSPQEVALRLIHLSLRLKQPEKALQYIRKGPSSLQFRLTAVNMLLEARHYLQAENILKQIAAGENAPVDVYLLLADLVFEQRHNLPMALEWLAKIPERDRNTPKVAATRAQLLAESGKGEEAVKEIQSALEQYPQSAELHELQIRILAREKKLSQALTQAAEAAQRWPDNNGIAFLYGSLLDESGKRSEALAVMESLLKRDPTNFQAMNYIGFTLAEQSRDLPRALELLKKADELSPDQAYIVDSLAWAYHKLGNGPEALKTIRRAVNLGGNGDAAIWEHYGDIAHKQGKKDEARRAYKRALDLKPENAAAVRAKLSKL